MELRISNELAETIQREARTRGVSVEDFLKATVRREKTISDRKKIELEQAWWLDRPLKVRAKYEGQFVAVHNQQLVDHDKNEEALSKRIRHKYGKLPVLIMPAEGPQEVRIYSPRVL